MYLAATQDLSFKLLPITYVFHQTISSSIELTAHSGPTASPGGEGVWLLRSASVADYS